MFSKRELENAIAEYEDKCNSFSDCQKLATYKILHAEYFPDKPKEQRTAVYSSLEPEPETIVDDYGDSEFYSTIRGLCAESVWAVMDELMTTLQVVNPRLYNATMRMIDEI